MRIAEMTTTIPNFLSPVDATATGARINLAHVVLTIV